MTAGRGAGAATGAESDGQVLSQEQILHQERVPVTQQHAQGAA
jgi:hypothetical protein